MSIESWKKEFYPIEAADVPKDQAVAHSLKKWQGLRDEAIARHGLSRTKYGDLSETVKDYHVDAVEEKVNRPDFFIVNDDSCALCIHYLKIQGDCFGCPVFELDNQCEEEYSAFYLYCYKGGDPEPMIAVLEKALELRRTPWYQGILSR